MFDDKLIQKFAKHFSFTNERTGTRSTLFKIPSIFSLQSSALFGGYSTQEKHLLFLNMLHFLNKIIHLRGIQIPNQVLPLIS